MAIFNNLLITSDLISRSKCSLLLPYGCKSSECKRCLTSSTIETYKIYCVVIYDNYCFEVQNLKKSCLYISLYVSYFFYKILMYNTINKYFYCSDYFDSKTNVKLSFRK